MENASKALIMAATVLLGIMILSLAVYLIITFGSKSAEMHKQIETDRLNQFNTQFTSYEGKQCTIYDVITVANLATENNKYYELSKISGIATGNDMYIQVRLKKSGSANFINIEYGYNSTADISLVNQSIIKQDIDKVIKGTDTTEKLPTYKCTVKISDITQRVYQVSFEQ